MRWLYFRVQCVRACVRACMRACVRACVLLLHLLKTLHFATIHSVHARTHAHKAGAQRVSVQCSSTFTETTRTVKDGEPRAVNRAQELCESRGGRP